jgi:hypothetical protein
MPAKKAALAALLAGSRISDALLRAKLGLSQGELLALGNELRTDLGISAMVSLRETLRAASSSAKKGR